MLNIATFNIFWYPEHEIAENERKEEDEIRIAQVLRNLAPHVIVFQEIVDLVRLQQLLERVGDSFCLKSSTGHWLASTAYSMNIACAYDADVLDLVEGSKLGDPVPGRRFGGRRYPYALHLRDRSTGWEFTVVGVHLKSGGLYGSDSHSEKRELEVEHLAGWLAGEPSAASGQFEQPPTSDVLVLGDFNALREHESLAKLRTGTLQTWHWPETKVVTSLSEGDPGLELEDPDECWTTFLDREVIDHVIASPGIGTRFRGLPSIYAFDLDPALDEDPSPSGHWLRRETSYKVKPYGGASLQTVENLYRISDHRPVVVSLDPS